MTQRTALTTILLLVVCSPSNAAEGKEMNELAGVWKCVSAVNDGKPVDEGTVSNLRLTLTELGNYKTTLGDQVLFDSSCMIDNTQDPSHIDMVGTEGANKGKLAQGIYRLIEDELTICYTMPGNVRPTEFKSEPGSAATLVVWQREQK